MSVTPPPDPLHALRDRLQAWAPTTFASGDFPHREFTALRDGGWLTVTLPGESLDARRGGARGVLQLLRTLGQSNLSVGRIYEGHVNALQLIDTFAAPDRRDRWFAEARAGHLFGVWNTQMDDGVHLETIPSGRVRMRGSKSFCSGSVHVTRPLVTGDLAGGWQLAVVPLDDYAPPVDTAFWTPLGMQNSVSHKIDFTGIELSDDDLLGSPGDYNRQPWLSGGAVRFAAVQLGGAAALLAATRDYLRALGRTTDPHQRSRVGQMAILVESGDGWLDRAARAIDRDEAVVHVANMTRTAIAGYCEECLDLAQHCVGARGLMHPHPVARLLTDLSMYLRQPAPDAALEAVGQYILDADAPR